MTNTKVKNLIRRVIPVTSNYTLTAADGYTLISVNSSSNLAVTIPADINFPNGTSVFVLRRGTGEVLISAGTGVTINSVSSGNLITTQNDIVALTKVNSTTWVLSGALTQQQLLLDVYPNAAAAYSLRKLRTAYTGSAIRVRRASNNAEQDIGFVNGQLDVAALQSFCAGTDGFVTRWYDQSGLGRNFEQDTAASQPQIVTSGVVNLENGRPAARFDGTDDWMEIPSSTAMFNFVHNGGDASFFSVQRFGNAANSNAIMTILSNNNSGIATGFSLWYDDRISVTAVKRQAVAVGNNVNLVVITRIDDIGTPNVMSLNYWRIDADNATAANRGRVGVNGGVDAGDNAETVSPTTANAQNTLRVGRIAAFTNVGLLVGAVTEIIIYNSNQTSNRTAIEANINNFYSIY